MFKLKLYAIPCFAALLVALPHAPVTAAAADTCAGLFTPEGSSRARSATAAPPQIQGKNRSLHDELRTSLRGQFDQITWNISQRLIDELVKKHEKGKLSRLDLRLSAEKYHKALSGNNFVQRAIKRLSPRGAADRLSATEEFFTSLEQFVRAQNLPINDTNLSRIRLWRINHRTPISWATFLAVNGALGLGAYNLTGYLIPPLYIPRLSNPNYRGHSHWQMTRVYVDGLFQSLMTTFYATALAVLVQNPEMATDVLSAAWSWISGEAQAEALGSSITVATDLSELKARHATLSAEVDQFFRDFPE